MTQVTPISPTRLLVNSRPSLWFMAFLWLALLAYLYFVMPAARLRLQRGANGIVDVHVEYRLMGVPFGGRWIRGVTNAELQFPSRNFSHGHPSGGVTLKIDDTARIAFATARGWEWVEKSFVAGSAGQREMVTRINEFIADARSTRASADVPRSGWLYFGLAILLFAAPGVTFGAWCRCEMDREADVVRMTWASIPRPQSVEYRLSDVERFQVLQTAMPLTSNRRRQRPQFTVVMRLRDGLETSVTRQYDSGPSEAMHAVARRLEKFRVGT